MAVKKSGGLGRGLEALFEDTLISQEVSVDEATGDGEEKTSSSNSVRYVDIDEIKPNPAQPRRQFDEIKISDLAESIKRHGMIQPIIVRPASSGEGYEIVAGERRWRAARNAEMRKIPCIVRELTDRENMLISIIENMQREDLNPIEEASAFQEMISRYELTQFEISQSVGKSRPYITNSLRLLKLPAAVQSLVEEGRLSGGHARAIAGIEDSELQIKLADMAKDGEMSVRALEKMIADAAEGGEKKTRKTTRKSPEVIAIENELKEVFGTKVKLPRSADKGKIEISFYSRDELERLVEMLKSLKN